VLKKILYTNITGSLKPNIGALSRQYEKLCYFDSNKKYNDLKFSENEGFLAIGSTRELVVKDAYNALQQLQSFCDEKRDWLFGYLNYDLKNVIEDLQSENADELKFPLIHFFSPLVVIQMGTTTHTLHFNNTFISEKEARQIYEIAFSVSSQEERAFSSPEIKHKITKQEYLDAFHEIKRHILRGDIYEINYCQEFFATDTRIDPTTIFEKLNVAAEAPFSAFCRLNDHYILSSSPERFLRKKGNELITQPIKGTIKRSTDKIEDEELKNRLRNDRKEQNENVMIVDLVRNDLSRLAKKGTVQVDELFGIYSFRQVHQMVSTVSCELKDNITISDILRATFPMGSMTGAPKVSAMRLIEQFENTKRGLYSGAIGYIDPDGNFDFSVVIRSILYNASEQYLSFMTGSAITSKAEAGQEYEECLLKAKAMFSVLK
jgi:para-aminobenzoate synthetase component 1